MEYECEKCRDIGILFPTSSGELVHFTHPDAVGATRGVQCECQERKRIKRLFQSSHITEEFQKLGFKNFTVEGRPKAVKQARDCAGDFFKKFDELRSSRHNSMALLGPPGSGKTHLSMAVSNNLMQKGVSVLYFPWVEGLGDLKDNLDELERKIGIMKRIEVLYIDDLFKGRKSPTDFQIEQLFAVINYRYLNHMPVIVSSEKSINEMCNIDEAIGSRIREMAKGHTIHMGLTDEEESDGIELNYRLKP